jgi:hypothetical protein
VHTTQDHALELLQETLAGVVSVRAAAGAGGRFRTTHEALLDAHAAARYTAQAAACYTQLCCNLVGSALYMVLVTTLLVGRRQAGGLPGGETVSAGVGIVPGGVPAWFQLSAAQGGVMIVNGAFINLLINMVSVAVRATIGCWMELKVAVWVSAQPREDAP